MWGLLTIQDLHSGKKLLHKLHNNLDEMKTELESWLDKGSKQSKLPQYSQRAQRVMERAAENAQELEQEYVGSEQLLVGLLAAGDGIAFWYCRSLRLRWPLSRSWCRRWMISARLCRAEISSVV